MTDIDHLEEIAETTAFGYQGVSPLRNAAHRHPGEYCGGGHFRTEETTRWYRDRGRMRRLCRICDKERKLKPKQCPSIAPGIAQAGGEQ
jgi:hypothetical protein